MDFHIIIILGMAGKDKDGKLVKSAYSKDSALDLPQLKNGEFYNSTHCLVESFGENATYTFIGTAESIKYQNDIFATLPQCKAIFEKFSPLVLRDSNEIEAIFHQIIESTKNSNSQNIILDITHGFRHQPIIASFASTLAQINTKKSITLLFAKEIEKDKKYQYVSLERYSQISLIALCLQTFSQTLSVPKIDSLDKNKYPFIDTLTRFSNALHTNAFAQIFGLLNEAKNELQKIKNGTRFKGLENILDDVNNVLTKFTEIQQIKEKHKQYYEISLLMNEKGYYLIAITYIREAIPLYVLDKLKDFIKNGTKYYDQTKAVNDYLNDGALNTNIFEDIDYLDKKLKQQNLQILKQMTDNIGRIRNDLAHINPKYKELKDIKKSLETTLNDFKQKCLLQDCLKGL